MKKFKEINDKNDPKMPLSLKNYILLLAGLIVIILGFVLMAGGGSDSPDEFNYAMFSWRRITLAPILVIGGFIFEIYAILKRFGIRTSPTAGSRVETRASPDTEISPRTVKWKPFKLSSWASSRA